MCVCALVEYIPNDFRSLAGVELVERCPFLFCCFFASWWVLLFLRSSRCRQTELFPFFSSLGLRLVDCFITFSAAHYSATAAAAASGFSATAVGTFFTRPSVVVLTPSSAGLIVKDIMLETAAQFRRAFFYFVVLVLPCCWQRALSRLYVVGICTRVCTWVYFFVFFFVLLFHYFTTGGYKTVTECSCIVGRCGRWNELLTRCFVSQLHWQEEFYCFISSRCKDKVEQQSIEGRNVTAKDASDMKG